MKYKVAIGKYQEFEDVLKKIGGLEKFVKPNDKVFIKPNFCATKSYDTGTVTNPYLIEKLLILLKKITNNITIGEGPIPVFGKLSKTVHPLVYEIAEKYNVEILDLNYTDKETIGSFVVAKPILEADVLINMPVLKTHVRTGVTISLKNMMGAVPLRLKHEMHKNGLDIRIVELAKVIKPHLNIVDATICQEGDGPTGGTPVGLDLVIVGDNQVAVDSMCCKIMKVNPRIITHIRLAEKAKLGSISDVEFIGFKPEFVHKFKLASMYKNMFIRLGMQIAEGSIIQFFERNNGILIDKSKCTKCNKCVQACPVTALVMFDEGPVVENKKCILCLCCHEACLNKAIMIKKKGITGSGIINSMKTK